VLPAQTSVLSFRAGEMVRSWSNMVLVKHGVGQTCAV
jgi:hypothetical protein